MTSKKMPAVPWEALEDGDISQPILDRFAKQEAPFQSNQSDYAHRSGEGFSCFTFSDEFD